MSEPLRPQDGAVVVVHYGDPELTGRALDSLAASTQTPGLVVLVDHDAVPWGDRPVPEALEVRILSPGANLGFAGGVNLGIGEAMTRSARWCWLLNNDATVEPDALSALLGALHAHPEADLAGSYVVLPDGRLWFGGGRFDPRSGRAWHQDYGQPVTTVANGGVVPTDWVTGCSLLLRTSAFADRGPFDERLFLYKEELDWQLRTRRPGQAVLVRRALVTHDPGQAGGGGRSRVETTFLARNQVLLAQRYAGFRLPVWLATLVLESVLGPAAKGHLRRSRWALEGMRSTRTDPQAVLARARGGHR